MTDTRETTLESLRAQLEAAEARAEVAETRANALEALVSRLPAVVLESELLPGGGMRTVFVGGVGVEALLGYSSEECMAQSHFWSSLVHPDDRAGLAPLGGALFREGEVKLGPHRLRRKDGAYVWVEAQLMIARSENGSPDRLHTLVYDISERRRAEHEARELLQKERVLRQRLDGFMADLPGIVWENYFMQDPSVSRSDFVNDRIEKISGYTVEEWHTPNFWLEIIHPEDREMATAASNAVLDNGTGSVSYRWIIKDGGIRWMTTWMRVIHDDGGAPIGMRGVTMDVTDYKLAEEATAETRMREARMRAQEESLLALSTPLVPIDDELLAMPLVGSIDGKRAGRVLEALLDGVTRSGAGAVILDVTGVPAVDAGTAEALLRAARAVALLGAEVVLTGIRPEVARTLVELDADLGAIVTRGTLKAGIAYAMGKRRGRSG
jgi:PAS domain S-box-containing protein